MPNASLTIDGTEVIKKENGVVSLKNTNADTSLSFPANHAGIKTALNASGDAPIYACRAWVNFDGTTNTAGFCTIRDSGNVSTVADNGTGDYTVNFATAMPDSNYSVVGTVTKRSASSTSAQIGPKGATSWDDGFDSIATGSIRLTCGLSDSAGTKDTDVVCISIFR